MICITCFCCSIKWRGVFLVKATLWLLKVHIMWKVESSYHKLFTTFVIRAPPYLSLIYSWIVMDRSPPIRCETCDAISSTSSLQRTEHCLTLTLSDSIIPSHTSTTGFSGAVYMLEMILLEIHICII